MTLRRPIRAVGGRPSPRGQSRLSPAMTTVAWKPIESRNQMSGMPMMAAPP